MERTLLSGRKPWPLFVLAVALCGLTALPVQACTIVIDGTVRLDDYTVDLWKEAAPGLKEAQAQLKTFGRFVSLTLVDRTEEAGKRSYRYRAEFEKNTLLQRFVFDENNKLAASQTEDIR